MTGCPHGWKVPGEDCYYLANSTHYTDWNNAHHTCNAYHGTLAMFMDEHPSAWAGATNGLPDLQYICECGSMASWSALMHGLQENQHLRHQ
ncbi:uncharacterized protein LOC143031036 isoform X2 [Oratosquilla oratoria]